MSPDDTIRLQHMLDALDSAQRFVNGKDRTALEADQMLVFALVRAIESAEGRAAVPGVPWASTVGMRNHLIHAYFDVDLDILWNTVTGSLPILRQQVQAALGP